VVRRIHTSALRGPGELTLSEGEAHHARDVLRLRSGDVVELFDDAGATARATILTSGAGGVVVRVDRPSPAAAADEVAVRLTIAAAIPKGDRAEWMIEKLSELSVARFIPLATARSVVLPTGKNKHQRWTRIATEAAKQSRRRGVMRIDELTNLDDALAAASAAGVCWHLSTAPGAAPVLKLIAQPPPQALTAFIGPEGGWTDEETARFQSACATGVALTPTILRVETAAVAIASIVGSVRREA
jgi:16S rRNA (uracil1498-N3)-methyltransferase